MKSGPVLLSRNLWA